MTIPERFYGHAPVPVPTYKCAQCGRGLDTDDGSEFTHQPSYDSIRNDGDAWYKQQEAEQRKARLAAAIPYAGAIARCQVSVMERGRAAYSGRCERKAKFVRTFTQDREDSPNPGFLAVCAQHAKTGHEYRWRYTKHFMEKFAPSANEPIEPEYLP